MSNPSNLYAEKIFSEHPSILWALDDKVDYVSLIKESDRRIDLWEDSNPSTRSGIFGGSAEQAILSNEPFPNSAITKLIGDVVEEDFGKIECISTDLLGDEGIILSDLNQELATFSIGAYVYTDSSYLSKIELGYEYYDAVSGENVQKLKEFNTSVSGKWIFISETFDIPNENTSMRLVVSITYSGGSVSSDNYEFFINGLSVGQWSEEFNSTSLGSDLIDLPSTIAISGKGVEAKSYGLQELSGYYLSNGENSIAAKNSGIPMVYGASNLTMIYPNGDMPSLIIPGDGFLNNVGKYKNYTVEFWIKISCDSVIEKRIFGPIASEDGIYVRGPFVTLKIGSNIGTYYVGEWLRPMLMAIRYTSENASLLINGEVAISIDLETSTISFPNKNNQYGKDQDWLGFYAYENVSTVEIDCVAIYPYQVSQILSKRRWVYGQGVEFPENINTAYSGSSIFIDSSFTNYANTYSYPDFGKWDQGILENLISENGNLSLPQYGLPSIVFDNKTYSEWMSDISSIQNELNNFISLKPNSSWASTNGYISVDSLNILNTDTKAFYGVFKQKENNSTEEILFEVQDISGLNYFRVSILDHKIYYKLKYGSETLEIYSSEAQYVGNEFSVGINIKDFVEYFGGNLPLFFGKKSSLRLYVGGNNKLEKTFSGNIYSVGICTERNLSKIYQFFNGKGLTIDNLDVFSVDGGIPTTDFWITTFDGQLPTTTSWDLSINPPNDFLAPSTIATESLANFTASYTVKPIDYFDNFKIDISVDAYWEDYVPLTYLAKYVTDADNDARYDLDFIQFNINYPAPASFVEENDFGSWTYEELQQKYAVPIQRTYESLDNQLFTGYDNYEDLKNKLFKTYKYDTSGSSVRSYVTFQYLASGANESTSYFTNIIAPDKNGIVVPGSYIVGYEDVTGHPIYDNFENTKYEVVDNMIIYMPKNVDLNELAMVTHLEFFVNGISINPIKIKKIQYSSQSFNDTTPNAIGTRFGNKIYPYKKSGVYYDYKSPNPFTVYKGTTPYLYLTRNSGIQLKGVYDPGVSRGIQIPINESRGSGYKVIALQKAIRYDEDFFSYAPTEIFEIQSKRSVIKFYLVANHPSGKRAKIYAINASSGQLENNIAFYWNGKLVKEPNITVKEWGMLGISFANSLDFENYSGAIRITGPILVNSISHYKSTNLQEVQQVVNRPWFKVKSFGPTNFDWQYWDTSYIWNGVLVLSSTSYYGVNPEDIYKTYTGTNKIIIDDERPLRLNSYEYRLLDDVIWQSNVANAV